MTAIEIDFSIRRKYNGTVDNVMSDLEKRIKTLEKKVEILEETLNTLKNMNLSQQMDDYIKKQTRTINFVELINSISDDTKIDFENECRKVQDIQEIKNNLDRQILEEANKSSLVEKDFELDLELFNYEIETGVEIDALSGDEKKIGELSESVGKGIRITAYNGFESKKIIIPNEIEGKPVTSIGENAFINSNIREIILPGSIKAILGKAFEGCKKLKKIDLPESVEFIGKYCFRKSGLVEFNSSSKLKEIPIGCFEECAELRNVRLNIGLVKLEIAAFRECFNLRDIILPDTLIEIENKCFERTKISTMIFPSSIVSVSTEMFGGRYTKHTNDVVGVFLGRETNVDVDSPSFLSNITQIYCLPGSKIQQVARMLSIPIKPLSEFKMEA